MKKNVLLVAIAILTGLDGASMAQDAKSYGGNSDSAWKLTLGVGVNTGMKAKLGFDAARAVSLSSGNATKGGRPQKAAVKEGKSYEVGSGRTSFPNGGYIDANDSANVEGETWNWYIPAGEIGSDGTMSRASPYSTVRSKDAYSEVNQEEDGAQAGLSLGLDLGLLQSPGAGLDVGLGVNWFQDSSFANFEGVVWQRTETKTSGTYVTDVRFNQELLADPWTQNSDGSYGSGTADGPGPVLTLDEDVSTSHHWSGGKSSTQTKSITMRAEGSYEEIELSLALKPYWEPAESFRLQGIIGVAAAYACFDFDVRATGGISDYSSNEKFSEWDVYGLAGAGAIVHSGMLCFGVDVVARLFANDIELAGKDIRGKVERAPVLVRMYIGIEL